MNYHLKIDVTFDAANANDAVLAVRELFGQLSYEQLEGSVPQEEALRYCGYIYLVPIPSPKTP